MGGKCIYLLNVSKEQLEKLYWKDNLSTRDIAKYYGIKDHMIVLRRMLRDNIKRRKNLVKPQYMKSKINSDNLSQTDIAYLAGIIDGEGCIHVGERISSPTLRILNSDKSLIEWIAIMFNTKIRIVIPKPSKYKRKIYYEISIQRHMDLITILKLIIPYLRIKKQNAINAVNHLEYRINQLVIT